ncbi:MAG: 4Fe-4S binding protein [bacterium]
MEADVVCVGFGPASAGFLLTLTRAIADRAETKPLSSRVMPGMPLQVICYERADDLAFGVSGAVTRGRGIRASFPGLDVREIPRAHPVTREKVLWLLDPIGASRRSRSVRALEAAMRAIPSVAREHAWELPWIPPFLRKHDGFLLSLGQFNQWVGGQIMGEGFAQIWPGTPVAAPLIEGERVAGVRLLDQGTDSAGRPDAGFLPGMDVRAPLTVVADGPVGPVGRALDERFGLPEGHERRDWAVGMKMVVDLREDCGLTPGTVLHTIGFPEPEIFGFLYVHDDHSASLGIFVPSWFDNPVRTAYRYLQHWMLHPRLWRHLEGGRMRSWGAKTLQESGRGGEPFLAGDGWARIGEGSGSTNVLTGSGVDEAWTTGVLLGEAVIKILEEGRTFTRAELERAYVAKRRASWVDREGRVAAHARDGFRDGFVRGLVGMSLSGMTGGLLHVPGRSRRPGERVPTLQEWCGPRISPEELAQLRSECAAKGVGLHDAVMDRLGWPKIEADGKLLVSHQDALLLGGKVQAAAGYADHVVFLDEDLCKACGQRLCVEMCSGQAITPGPDGVPRFDREKCVHCGACLWSCPETQDGADRSNVSFRAGAGGLHTVEN